LVPEVKLRLGLDDAALGAAMLGFGAGALAGTLLAGRLAQRFGCRSVIMAGGFLFCALLPGVALAPSVAVLAVLLVCFGATLATVDVAMNAQAVAIERATGRTRMSGFHGLFSLGGLLGVGATSALLAVGGPAAGAAATVGLAGATLLVAAAPALLPATPVAAASAAWPHGKLLLIGALCFISFLAEGAMLDWSAVLLRLHRGAGAGAAGMGYAAFSVTMAGMRLSGDALARRFGSVALLRGGAVVAAAGFFLCGGVDSAAAGIAGGALAGLGCANMVPQLFAAAGRLPGLAPGPAISAAAAPGYVGMLAGPGLIGFAAASVGLPVALLGVAALLLVVLLFARRVGDGHDG
jgi:MFS family permease